ncbi:hypothetical protein SI65_05454 [Aspergillus cristatus]|uniref:Uncharacterized protein n=1 Tax=Aspergillus cristatus TaxID=573508 RepID=A0A1E3BD30_ASPCR|nr:hypothetical protein SI65_05454 [Aspergillus cristatus]
MATVSGVDVGGVCCKGMKNPAFKMDHAALSKALEAAGTTQIAEAKGKPAPVQPIVPGSPEGLPKSLPAMFWEGSDYYQIPQTKHSQSMNHFPIQSLDLLCLICFQSLDLSSAAVDDYWK